MTTTTITNIRNLQSIATYRDSRQPYRPACPWEVPPEKPEMTRASRYPVTNPVRITGTARYETIMAALREVGDDGMGNMQ